MLNFRTSDDALLGKDCFVPGEGVDSALSSDSGLPLLALGFSFFDFFDFLFSSKLESPSENEFFFPPSLKEPNLTPPVLLFVTVFSGAPLLCDEDDPVLFDEEVKLLISEISGEETPDETFWSVCFVSISVLTAIGFGK
jgi:hypothetical protein